MWQTRVPTGRLTPKVPKIHLVYKPISDASDVHKKGWVYVLQVNINVQSAVKIGSTK